MTTRLAIRRPIKRNIRRPVRFNALYDAFRSAESGGRYDEPTTKTQTTAGLVAASAVGDPVGLLVSRQPPGDGRGVVNFLLGTAALATQNVTTLNVEYTLSFKGTGTVTLTGTSTAGPLVGTGANDIVSLTFTPTAGTLTCTVSGSCTEAMLNFGATRLEYQANTVSLGGSAASINPYQGTAASRPTLGRAPRGGRRNQLTKSNDVSNAAWSVKTNVTLTPGVSDPFGGTTAFTMSRTSALSSAIVGQVVTGLTATDYVGSWYVRRNTGNTDTIDLVVGDNVNQTITVTSSWQRLSKTDNTSSTTVRNYISLTGAGTDTIDICYSQLEFGTVPTALQVVDAVYDITESGVPSVTALYYDGGDCLTTGVQEITSTADFFADAGHAWAVGFAFSTFGNTFRLFSKSSTTSANVTCEIGVNSGGALFTNLRGSVDSDAIVNDGAWDVGLLSWDGTTAKLYLNTATATQTVGSAVEEALDVIFGARNSASPSAFFTGFLNIDLLLSRAPSAAEAAQIMANLNATYRGV